MYHLHSRQRIAWVLVSLVLFSIVGCTTVKSPDVYNEVLQEKIRSERIIQEGDHVIIHTLDNAKYEFTVTEIDDQKIEGEGVSVKIDEIAALRTESFSLGKTAGLAGGIGAGVYILIGLALMASAGLIF